MKKINISIVIFVILLTACKKNDSFHFYTIPLSDVKVEGYLGDQINKTIDNNILKINVDSVFLRHYIKRSDKPGVRDDYLGFGQYIDALVRLAYYTNRPDLIQLKDRIISSLIASQDADGYIGIFPTIKRREHTWDCQDRFFNIIALANNYKYFKHYGSLQAAEKLSDYSMTHSNEEILTMEGAFILLYQITQNKKYFDYVTNVSGCPEYKNGSFCNGAHVYAALDRNLAQLKLYEFTGERSLLYKPVSNLQSMLTLSAMDMVGTCGRDERWSNANEGKWPNGETCASVYNIMVLNELLKIEGKAYYGDILERVLYNAAFAAQSPDGRRLRYFTNFQEKREYYKDDYFCCPGNYRRLIADLPQLIYYRSDDGIVVNLYNSSSAKIQVGRDSVTISQKTEYPTFGNVKITIDQKKEKSFTLYLRIPLWCDNPVITAGNDTLKGVTSGEYYSITRRWKKGEIVQLDMKMPYKFYIGRLGWEQASRVALVRGPLFYCISKDQNQEIFSNPVYKVTIDPLSVSAPISSFEVRKNGMTVNAEISSINDAKVNKKIIFSEFTDPGCQRTFFNLPDSLMASFAVKDKLFINEWKINLNKQKEIK